MAKAITYITSLMAVILAGGASFASPGFLLKHKKQNEYQATFKSGRFNIPTVQQLLEQVHDLHPSLAFDSEKIASVSFKNKNYAGFVVNAEGVESSSKIEQKITYVEILPGLWRMVYVDAKVCIRGKTLNAEQKWVEGWMCKTEPFPIKGFQDIYLVESANVDLKIIQQAFEDPIKPYPVNSDEESQQEKLMSIGDLEKYLKQLGSSMILAKTTYQDALKENAPIQPAIQLTVTGQLNDGRKVQQEFVYIVVGKKLKMKTINGQICQFAKTLNKEICDPIYVPTPATPLPLQLVNDVKVTGVMPQKPEVKKQTLSPENQCGGLQADFSTILRVHFERSFLDANKSSEFERFLKKFPEMADPSGLLFTQQEKLEKWKSFKQQSHYDVGLKKLVKEFNKGDRGDCQFLADFMRSLKQEVLLRSGEVFQILALLKEKNFVTEIINDQDRGWTSFQKKFFRQFVSVMNPQMKALNSSIAADLTAGQVRHYIQDLLARMSDLEEFTVSAMAKQDYYSRMIAQPAVVDNSLNGFQRKKYFGVAVEQGYSGRFYLTRVHPLAGEQGLSYSDEILEVDGEGTANMTYEQLDQRLMNVTKPLQLTLRHTDARVEKLTLVAQDINPLDLYYSVRMARHDNKNIIEVKLNSFESGITEQVYQEMQELMSKNKVEGFVLDLRNNPGGNTDEAVNTMSLFVKDRIVSYARLGQRNLAQLKVLRAKPEFFIDDQLPLEVLVNHQTMSSAEIVTSGLKALGRSITVGERTHGKLVGQFYVPLTLASNKKVGLLLTAFEFYNVKGEALNGIGIMPDKVLSEPMAQDIDDGIGPGKDLAAGDLESVPLYQFKVADITDYWKIAL